MLRLNYLTANAAWMFTFGDAPLTLDQCPMFFPTRQEAVEAANKLGLDVLATNEVRARPDADAPEDGPCVRCGHALEDHDDPTLACPATDNPED